MSLKLSEEIVKYLYHILSSDLLGSKAGEELDIDLTCQPFIKQEGNIDVQSPPICNSIRVEGISHNKSKKYIFYIYISVSKEPKSNYTFPSSIYFVQSLPCVCENRSDTYGDKKFYNTNLRIMAKYKLECNTTAEDLHNLTLAAIKVFSEQASDIEAETFYTLGSPINPLSIDMLFKSYNIQS